MIATTTIISSRVKAARFCCDSFVYAWFFPQPDFDLRSISTFKYNKGSHERAMRPDSDRFLRPVQSILVVGLTTLARSPYLFATLLMLKIGINRPISTTMMMTASPKASGVRAV